MESASYPISVVIEGDPDETIMRRVLKYVGLPCGIVYGKQGKDYILASPSRYNQAARFWPWLAVVDLDQDADCAPAFIRDVLPNPAPGMRFRVAVRAIESWLLADHEHLARFLGISATLFPRNPDAEPNPKSTLVNLARRTRRTRIYEDIVPREGSGSHVGPGYSGRLIEFVETATRPWRPEVAIERSDSLRRCVAALQSFKTWGQE